MGAAIRMFYSGMSYKQIAESMEKMYDIPEPSKATIYEWVRDYTQVALKEMKDHKAHTGGHWVADEMQLTVGGKKYWNWNVMDADTRYILASHLTVERDAAAATAVMRKALAAADGPPDSITTDKLRSYLSAIKKVFPDAKHIQSEGIRAEVNNNLSERVQGTFRQRTKTLRGLDHKESGQLYLDGWVLTYNLFRDHEAMGGKPPGLAAEVNPPFTEWADVVRGEVLPKSTDPVTSAGKPTRPPIPEGTDIKPTPIVDTGRPQIPMGVDVATVAPPPPKRGNGRPKTPAHLKSKSGYKPRRPSKNAGRSSMPAEIRRAARKLGKR